MNEEEKIKLAELLLSVCDLLDKMIDTATKIYCD